MRSQNNLFSSKNLFEKEEDNISLKSNDIISFSYEIDNLNKNEKRGRPLFLEKSKRIF